jgi:hypothetical protein
MSERDDRYVGNDSPSLPRTTGEFRAAPDASASTAEFRAFAAGQAGRPGQVVDSSGSWPEQPWAGEAPASGSGRTIALVIGAVVAVAIVLAVILLVV